jgi:hypothetical protein
MSKFYLSVQWYLQTLHGSGAIEDIEACSIDAIEKAFKAYEREKFIRIVPGGKKKETVIKVLVSV